MAEEAKPRLALDDMFSNSSPEKPESAVTPSPVKVEAEKIADTPIETKPEAAAPAKVEAAKEKSEAKPEVKAEAKTEEKLSEAEEKKKEEPPKFDWESDSNPYKKRYADTQAWRSREKQDYDRQFEILNKKLDGTYDPATDQPKAPAPQEIAVQAERFGRVASSLGAAYELYGGKENVDKAMIEFNRLYDNNTAVQTRILSSPLPVVEAMKVMEEAKVFSKLGSDPRKWEENLRKQILEAEEARITEKVSKELMARVSKKETVAPSLTEVRGAGKEMGEKPAFVPTPLNEVFAR